MHNKFVSLPFVGFVKRTSKGGLIKTKRKRKKQTVKIGYEKIFVKKI